MSHDHNTPNQPDASSTPPASQPSVPLPHRMEHDSPPLQPSSWLNPTVRSMSEEEVPDDQRTDEEEVVVTEDEAPPEAYPRRRRRLPYGRAYVKQPGDAAAQPERGTRQRMPSTDGQTRIKILDTWMRSKLPAGDFAPLVNVSKHTLYLWKQRFEAEGPAGLLDKPRGAPDREPPAGHHQAGDPDDEGSCTPIGAWIGSRTCCCAPGAAGLPRPPSPRC